MFSEKLFKEQEFATKLFTASIKSGKVAHTLMFTKAQAIVQYEFALELAKILNCNNKIEDNPCNVCTNCKWISSNSHPEVITVSPVDFSYDPGKKNKKNIITANQAKEVRKHLMNTSNYYRVIIFAGAKNEKLTEEEQEHLWLDYKGKIQPPYSSEKRDNWVIDHLNRSCFGSDPANILLKTFEEPPPNVLFIFLTKDSEDMIDTIVSRSQVFVIKPKIEFKLEPTEYMDKLNLLLPPLNELDCLITTKKLLEFAKKEEFELKQVIEFIELIYRKKLLNNIYSPILIRKLITRIKAIEKAKLMLDNFVNPQATLFSMLKALIEKK